MKAIQLTFNGKTNSLGQWAAILKVNKSTLEQRLRHGWSVEKTLTAPILSRPEIIKLLAVHNRTSNGFNIIRGKAWKHVYECH